MASLVKKNRSYYIREVLGPNHFSGKKEAWISLKTRDPQEAEILFQKYKLSNLTGATSSLPSKTKLDELLEEYCLSLKTSLRHENYVKECSLLRNIFGPACDALGKIMTPAFADSDECPEKEMNALVLKNEFIERITTRDISLFLTILMDKRGFCGKTSNNYREIINRFFNWAASQRGVRFPNGVNPAAIVKKHKIADPEITYLDKDQILMQLDALRNYPAIQAMVATLIFAGLRREELLWLRRSDILCDKSGNYSIMVHAKTVDGKSWHPKNRKNRSVPVSKALKGFLLPYLNIRQSDEWLFKSPTGKRWDRDNFSAVLKELNSNAAFSLAERGKNLPVWSSGDYRHTFATLLASKGTSLYRISVLMGNSVAICSKHYAKLIPSSLRSAIDILDGELCQDDFVMLSDKIVGAVDCKVDEGAVIEKILSTQDCKEVTDKPEIRRNHLRLVKAV